MFADLLSQLFSYSLHDFLLFSPEVYWRLVTNYLNAHQLIGADVAIATSIAVYLLVKHRYPRLVLCFIALLWLWLGWQFYLTHYQTINHHASYLGLICFLQVALLVALAIKENYFQNKAANAKKITVGLIISTMLTMPILAVSSGLPWSAGMAGLMPIPTVILSLFFTSQLASRWRYLLYPLPVLIAVVELLTLDLLTWQLIT
ncbi:DUF6064 family protein [Thalassotalea montiporae]